MPTIYITEFKDDGQSAIGKPMPLAQTPSIRTQTVTIGASSAQSQPFTSATRFVRVHTDSVCHVVFGDAPVATTGAARMSADQTEYFGVATGQQLAVIQGV